MIKVGSKVKYVCEMPEGTWMDSPWGEIAGFEIGKEYTVSQADLGLAPSIRIKEDEKNFDIDVNCFEEVK